VLIAFWTFIGEPHYLRPAPVRGRGKPRQPARAGINVPRIKILVFMIAGIMATISGAMDASRHVSAYPLARLGSTSDVCDRAAVIGRHEPLRRSRPGEGRAARALGCHHDDRQRL